MHSTLPHGKGPRAASGKDGQETPHVHHISESSTVADSDAMVVDSGHKRTKRRSAGRGRGYSASSIGSSGCYEVSESVASGFSLSDIPDVDSRGSPSGRLDSSFCHSVLGPKRTAPTAAATASQKQRASTSHCAAAEVSMLRAEVAELRCLLQSSLITQQACSQPQASREAEPSLCAAVNELRRAVEALSEMQGRASPQPPDVPQPRPRPPIACSPSPPLEPRWLGNAKGSSHDVALPGQGLPPCLPMPPEDIDSSSLSCDPAPARVGEGIKTGQPLEDIDSSSVSCDPAPTQLGEGIQAGQQRRRKRRGARKSRTHELEQRRRHDDSLYWNAVTREQWRRAARSIGVVDKRPRHESLSSGIWVHTDGSAEDGPPKPSASSSAARAVGSRTPANRGTSESNLTRDRSGDRRPSAVGVQQQASPPERESPAGPHLWERSEDQASDHRSSSRDSCWGSRYWERSPSRGSSSGSITATEAEEVAAPSAAATAESTSPEASRGRGISGLSASSSRDRFRASASLGNPDSGSEGSQEQNHTL